MTEGLFVLLQKFHWTKTAKNAIISRKTAGIPAGGRALFWGLGRSQEPFLYLLRLHNNRVRAKQFAADVLFYGDRVVVLSE